MGTDSLLDWSGAGQEDTGATSNSDLGVTSFNICGFCGYFLGRDENLFAQRYWTHLQNSTTCKGAYTVVRARAVYHLLQCSGCGIYKRGDFAFYEYPTYPGGGSAVYVHLTEDQIKELGLPLYR